MRTSHRFFAPIAVAILTIFGVVGCGSSGSSTGPVTVTVSPSNPSVAVGQMQTFTANVVGGTTPATVTWSVTGAGTIDSSTGVYTAPMSVPATPDTVMAMSQGSTGSAIVNVTASQTLQISPSGPVVPAGASQAFTATAAGNPVGSITWQVNGIPGGDCSVPPGNNATTPCHGTISPTGMFTAPLSPPPGQAAVITALSGTDTGTTSATIQYSSASFTSNGSTGQYAIQYSGSAFPSAIAQGGPFNLVGSISTSGASNQNTGNITGGEVDISTFDFGISPATAITGGQYTINPQDGRGSMTLTMTSSNTPSITSLTLQFVLTTNQHGLVIEFDTLATGSGTIDAQNTSSFTGSLAGNYVFSYSGLDPTLVPMFGAGAFTANGGSIPVSPTNAPTNTQDIVDAAFNPAVFTNDVTLSGFYTTAIDANGRGTLSMSSTTLNTITTTTAPINFSFYMIDQTHAVMVETDSTVTTPLLFGQIYSAPASPTALASGIAFTAGGSSGGNNFNPYVIGGVFGLNTNATNSSITSGLLDINTSGGSQVATAITGGTYTNSLSSGNVPGRFTLSITNSKGTIEFGAYTTSINTALLVQIDTNTDGSTGTAYQQSSPPTNLTGAFATNLTGVASNKQKTFSFEQDATGEVVLATNSGAPVINSGTLDLNSGASGPVTLPINPAKSTFGTPAGNRGTAVLSTGSGPFSITYYLVSPTTALFIDTDSTRVANGIFLDQF